MMKKFFCCLLALGLYSSNHCVNKYVYTFFDDNIHFEWQINKLPDNTWYFTEYKYNVDNGFCTMVNEGQSNDDRVQFITNMVQKLSLDPEIRYQNIIQLLDQETITFLRNKEFFRVADTPFIFILTLIQKDNCIELVVRKATPEERKIYIKLKAYEYAKIKKALDGNTMKLESL
ncbi:MAG TPA: hypothetical protein VL201_00455 [Patescibacteria group bacterium]|jgi:hypothetical protein|nr:hypothetical protein [Patescibacteria group bacterium]